jgi:hypothetical protein
MAKDSPLGIFLFVYEWVVTALLPVLFLKKIRVFHFSINNLQKSNIFTVHSYQFY